jgi:transcriptional regulator with XRE-family HTH domain
MNWYQVRTVGSVIRQRRQELGLTTRQLAELTGVAHSSIGRIETGAFAQPSIDKLRRIAGALQLDPARLLSLGGMEPPADLLPPLPYLRTKFRDLSPEAMDALSRDVIHVLRRHGIDPGDGPAPGEDELPETVHLPSNGGRS